MSAPSTTAVLDAFLSSEKVPMPVREAAKSPLRQKEGLGYSALMSGVSVIALLLMAGQGASARPLGSAAQGASATANAIAAATANAQQAAQMAQQSMRSLARATQAVQAMQAAQSAARNLAIG